MSCLRLRLFWPEYFETTTSSIYLNNRARLNKIDITIYYVYVGEVYRQNASRDELYWPERQYLIVWHRICVYVFFPLSLPPVLSIVRLLWFSPLLVRYPRQINANTYQMKMLSTCAHMPFQIKIKLKQKTAKTNA